jgi:hypothetical protein
VTSFFTIELGCELLSSHVTHLDYAEIQQMYIAKSGPSRIFFSLNCTKKQHQRCYFLWFPLLAHSWAGYVANGQVSTHMRSLFFMQSHVCVSDIRYEWKRDLIAGTKEKANEPPSDIRNLAAYASFLNNSSDFKGKRLIVEGGFDHSREVLLGPRSAPVGMFGPAAQGLATNPQVSASLGDSILHHWTQD